MIHSLKSLNFLRAWFQLLHHAVKNQNESSLWLTGQWCEQPPQYHDTKINNGQLAQQLDKTYWELWEPRAQEPCTMLGKSGPNRQSRRRAMAWRPCIPMKRLFKAYLPLDHRISHTFQCLNHWPSSPRPQKKLGSVCRTSPQNWMICPHRSHNFFQGLSSIISIFFDPILRTFFIFSIFSLLIVFRFFPVSLLFFLFPF